MKKFFYILVVLLVFVVISENKIEGKKKPDILQSQSSVLQIGLRKKGDGKIHSASLEITYQNGKNYIIDTAFYPNSEWQYIYYQPGVTGSDEENFFWECKIDEKVIEKGSFESDGFSMKIPKSSYKKPGITEAGTEWESSCAFTATLSVWDKHHQIGLSYKAVFIVTDPKGRKSKSTQYHYGDSFCETDFPTDFQADFQTSGTYSWVCVINGQIVAGDKFQYKPFYINTY
ncbi:MAG: hypothetical protein FD167_2703 [bacterium]|nr:MAG: hypothetical protein FD167_2703 [bacterium]